MFKSKLAALVSLAAIGAGVAGCSTVVDKSYDSVRSDMEQVKSGIEQSRQVRKSSVENVEGIWLGGESFKVAEDAQAPSILKRNVKFRQSDPVSMTDLTPLLSADLGMRLILTQDAVDYMRERATTAGPTSSADELTFGAPELGSTSSQLMFTVNYEGKVSGLFDLLAAKTGLFWRFERGEIVFKRNETKNYVVDVVPGTVEYTATMKSDLSAGSEEETSSDSVHEVEQKFEPKGAWVTLEEQIKSQLSPTGQLAMSESLGTVTITDTPQVHSKIARHIKNVNAIAGKQIAVRTDVFEITSDENGEFDTNIMALYDWKGDLTLDMSGDTLKFGLSNGDEANDNRFSRESSATLKMLRTNKNASLVTSSTIYAMNGQPTPFQQLDEISYLKEMTVTRTEGANEPTVSMTAGKTSQGFSMMIMPRIMSDSRVMMNFAVDSSRINSIDAYGTETQGRIQLPNRSTNKYNQLVSVRSGQQLMIAGLERTENSANIGSNFGRSAWMLGGNQKGGKRKMMTMIVLTPYIMQK